MEIHPVDGNSTRGWLDFPPSAPKMDGWKSNHPWAKARPENFKKLYGPLMQSSQNGVYLGGVGVKLPLFFSFLFSFFFFFFFGGGVYLICWIITTVKVAVDCHSPIFLYWKWKCIVVIHSNLEVCFQFKWETRLSSIVPQLAWIILKVTSHKGQRFLLGGDGSTSHKCWI